MEFAPQKNEQTRDQASFESIGARSFQETFEFELSSDIKYFIAKNKKTNKKCVVFFPATDGSHKDMFNVFVTNHSSENFEVIGGGEVSYDADENNPEKPSDINKDNVNIIRTKSTTLNVATSKEDFALVKEQAEKYYKSLKI